MAKPGCLIAGGAGFLGINLVRLLLSKDWAVRSLDIATFDYPERSRADAMLGDIRDIRDAGVVERAMADVGMVVHCAAALPLADEAEIRSTGVDGTRLLLEAAWRHGVSRFIFISSTAVYGIPDHHPICETDALHGVGPYGQAKIEAERLCAEFRARGLCVTILRPKVLSDLSAWVLLSCCTTGRLTAMASPCWAAVTTFTSCLTSRTSAR